MVCLILLLPSNTLLKLAYLSYLICYGLSRLGAAEYPLFLNPLISNEIQKILFQLSLSCGNRSKLDDRYQVMDIMF